MESKQQVIGAVFKALENKYMRAESLMVKPEGAKTLQSFLPEIETEFTKLMDLCSSLSDEDVLPETSSRKVDCIRGKAEFDTHVQKWLDNVQRAAVMSTPPIPPLVDSPAVRGVAKSFRSSASSTSSMRSLRIKEAQVKVQLARFARQHDVERKTEQEALANFEREQEALKVEQEAFQLKLKLEQEARKKQLLSEIQDRESRRKLELAEEEAKAWDEDTNAGSSQHGVQHTGYSGSRTPLLSNSKGYVADPPTVPKLVYPTPVHAADFKPSALLRQTKMEAPHNGYEAQMKDHLTAHCNELPFAQASTSALRNYTKRISDVGERFLPRPLVDKFDGDPLDYWSFVNRYQLHIADKVDTYDLRLAYLLQHCTKPVEEKIKHRANCKDARVAYELVWRDLFDRYGQPHIIARRCEKILQETPKVGNNDPEALETLAVLLKNCCASLDKITGVSTVDSVGFISAVAGKLPVKLQEAWISESLQVQDKTGRVALFADFANFVVEQSRKANSVFGKCLFPSGTEKTASGNSKRQKVSAYNVVVDNQSKLDREYIRQQCLCCGKEHRLEECADFKRKPQRDRRNFVRDKFLCYKCFDPDHISKNCPMQTTCVEEGCDSSNHHTLLHNHNWKGRSSRNISRKNETSGSESTGSDCLHSVTCNSTVQHHLAVFLDMVPVRVRHGGKEVKTYALLDSASNKSFCERSLVEMLGASSGAQDVHLKLNTLSTGNPQIVNTASVSLTVMALDGSNEFELPEVLQVDQIPANPCVVPAPEKLREFKHLQGIELPRVDDCTVMLLIGNDCAFAHRSLESRFAPNPHESPDAVRTPLGWLLKGPSLASSDGVSTNFLLSAVGVPHEVQGLEDLLIDDQGDVIPTSMGDDSGDIEALMRWLRSNKEASEFGMKYSREDVVAYDMMTRLVERVYGHYQLPLLWKNDAAPLAESIQMAQGRLEGLKKRLMRNEELRRKYGEDMELSVKRGYCERVPDGEIAPTNKVWYLPHHPVINPKKPNKVRIVYDCAAKCRGLSLNDRLMKGPDLVNPLMGVLMRFRKDRIAIVSDIEAMFHQVHVAPRDRDALRFLWWPEGDTSKPAVPYRMKVHLFGARSSPSCAAFCLRQTAREYGKFFAPKVAEILIKNFYVDDCLTTAPDDATGIKLVKDLRDLLQMGGFRLTKWLSTSESVMESIPVEDRSKAAQNIPLGGGIEERVLGINWSVPEDEFRFSTVVPAERLTRRGMLSITNSLFDPLGFVAPVVLEARLIYRDLCQQKVDWDEEVVGPELARWKSWCDSLDRLRDVRIPRCFKQQMFDSAPGVQLHFFADASKVARGSVCYLRTVAKDESVHVTLVMGKSLLSGPGKHTIPRLELEAALDAVKLSRTVKRELGLQDCPCVFWTDSTIVLQSLFADCKNLPVFSRNRLAQIEDYTCVYDWRHVPTNLNPADQASRGVTAHNLIKNGTWFSGPGFLKLPPEKWPNRFVKQEVSQEFYKRFDPEKNVEVFLSSTDTQPLDRLVARFSSLYRLKVATAWLLRFKAYLRLRVKKKGELKGGALTVNELENAEIALVKYAQWQEFSQWMSALSVNKNVPRAADKVSQLHRLNPILVGSLLRVGGRLHSAPMSYEARHPMILPQNSHLTELVINYYHCNVVAHSGVNHTLCVMAQRLWVVNAKVATRRVLNKCLFCRRRSAKPGMQMMADLPPARLQMGEPPFSHTGVDYFGPILIKHRRSEVKRYGCLFTCMTTRAIHLEVAQDLSTDAFFNVLRRFMSRRGPVRHMYSDNGTNFVGCQRILREAAAVWNQHQIHGNLRQREIEWHFNPPAASHFGGVWERLIRSVRRILMAVTPSKPLDDDSLHTLFVEVEDIVNSRPLTEVHLEPGDELPLTPNHLLRINPNVGLLPIATSKSDCYARRRFRLVQYAADEFWRRWIQEYPRSIMQRSKWHDRKENYAVGDVVLLVDQSNPRGQWPLGRVLSLFHDRHGIVRSVEVRTARGIMKRPIAKLCVIVPVGRRDEPGDEQQA